jgi:hypothetical protein
MSSYGSGGGGAMGLDLITAAWMLVLVLGIVVTFYGAMAYRRVPNRSTLTLALGFGFLSVGTAGSWFGIYVATASLFEAQFACAGFLAAGFAIILYSLFTKVG